MPLDAMTKYFLPSFTSFFSVFTKMYRTRECLDSQEKWSLVVDVFVVVEVVVVVVDCTR
jgi:hypothetical protein